MPGITNPAEPFFKDGGWGWDGTLWRKLPLVWGYSDAYRENVALQGAAATLTLDFSACDPGEVWVVNSVACWPESGDHADYVWMGLYADATNIALITAPSLLQWTSLALSIPIVLGEGDKVRVTFNTAVLNNWFSASVSGYKMKIAE